MRVLILIILLIPLNLFSQELKIDSSCCCSPEELLKENEDGYVLVEYAPIYPSGNENAYRDFLNNNIEFDSCVNGKILISFIINCNGLTCGFDMKILEGNIPDNSKNEILNKISKMEKWEPAKNRGKPVDIPMKSIIKIKNGKMEI